LLQYRVSNGLFIISFSNVNDAEESAIYSENKT